MTRQVIAVLNQKGGVGKTTTTAMLAQRLAELGQRVLGVDLDPQASLTELVGVTVGQDALTVTDVLLAAAKGEDHPLSAVAVPAPEPWNFDVAPSQIELAAFETQGDVTAAETLLKVTLDHDEMKPYDIIVLDCPPSLGRLTINALTACTALVVVTQPEFLAMRGIMQLEATIERVRRRLNPNLQIDAVVINGYAKDQTEHKERYPELLDYFGDKVAATIKKRAAISNAAGQGIPAHTSPKASREVRDELTDALDALIERLPE